MILLLGGTAEARDLARRLVDAGAPVLTSLAGATRDAARVAGRVRVGGFGGEEGFRQVLAAEGITRIVDATHPFAHRISARTARIARAMGLPYLQLLRPPWEAGPGDIWHEIATEEEAARLIPPGATVFLATGRQTLDRFKGLEGRRVICRQIDPPDRPFPFEGGEYLIGRPPFPVEREEALFRELGVDWLVVKNAGGAASRPKLDAARQLGLPVAMIARPPQPKGVPRVETVDEAFDWARTGWR